MKQISSIIPILACTSLEKESQPQEEDTLHCASSGTPAPYNNGWIVEGEHYSLYSETSQEEAEIMSKMIESSFSAMEEWFHSSPPSTTQLVVEVYQTETAWANAIAFDGLDIPYGAGGYYHPTTQKAYLYVQPTRYYTRQLLIHEVIHQFHDLIRTSDRALPGWYVEGIAEYMSMYDWDGSCIQLGRLPLITQEDMPQRALQESSTLSLREHFQENDSVSRPLEWAMFRYFDIHHAEQWDDFRYEMDEGEMDATSIFESLFDESLEDFEAPILSWLEEEQQSFIATYLEWSHIDSQNVEGWSDFFSIAPLKTTTHEFSVHVSSLSPSWAGGILLSFNDTDNWSALVVNEEGTLQTFEVTQGEALWWDKGAVQQSENGYSYVVYPEVDQVRTLINGEEKIIPISFEPATGLALNASHIRFSDIAWRVSP